MKHDTLLRAAAVQAVASDGAVHLLPADCPDWIVLGGTARLIWERLEYPATVADIATKLSVDYDAPLERIRQDVASLAAELLRRGVLAECSDSPDALRNRYLFLLKRALGNLLYPELELQMQHLERGAGGLGGAELRRYQRDISLHEAEGFAGLLAAKLQGTGPPRHPHTMIGHFRLSNIERCAERVISDGVPGDFLEAGVCKGGASIFMRALQLALGSPERRTWVVDSFAGCPSSEAPVDAAYDLHLEESRLPWLACSEDQVREHFRRYDLLDANVRFVAGWLADSVPTAGIGPLAILRIDVDLYSSTSQCLDLLYDNVSQGGFVIVDDYGFLECCRDAVDDFRRQRGIEEPIRWIDGSGIYWRKGEGS